MRPNDRSLAQQYTIGLSFFNKYIQPLPGINSAEAFATFIEQLLESIHRKKYVSIISNRRLSEECADPSSILFDPIKAAILCHRKRNIDEAFWLIFLSTHFGKHKRAGWHYVREIYGRLGEDDHWNWNNICMNLDGFKSWLRDNEKYLQQVGIPHGFGNHRKYESLNASKTNGTGAVIESYINWVGPQNSHQDLISRAYQYSGDNPRISFNYLYNSMGMVKRFGRTARFDYLTMISNIGLANLEPGFAYLQYSTGPIRGARLLFGGNKKSAVKATKLEGLLQELDEHLGVGFQVLEDALCNWQKSPRVFIKFRG